MEAEYKKLINEKEKVKKGNKKLFKGQSSQWVTAKTSKKI